LFHREAIFFFRCVSHHGALGPFKRRAQTRSVVYTVVVSWTKSTWGIRGILAALLGTACFNPDDVDSLSGASGTDDGLDPTDGATNSATRGRDDSTSAADGETGQSGPTCDSRCLCEGDGQTTCSAQFGSLGACGVRVLTCAGGMWPIDECSPLAEEVCDGTRVDDDCDGEANEGCDCDQGQETTCEAEFGTGGICGGRVITCALDGNWSATACAGEPSPEACDGARVDDDCDGEVNEGCECDEGEQTTCGEEFASVGVCAAQAIQCSAQGTWPADVAACAPIGPELCDPGRLDENCDGLANERPPCEAYVQIDTGRAHTCAVTTDQRVQCWGDNSQGQLGDGTFDERRVPGPFVAIPPATQVSAKGGLTCARLADGGVRCWGDNRQSGTGAISPNDQPQPDPVTVSFPEPALSVAAAAGGSGGACAVLEDETLYCWGYHHPDVIRTGVGNPTPTPYDVTGVVEAAVGFNHICVRTRLGTVLCSGSNEEGQLGDGTFVDGTFSFSEEFVPVGGISTAVSLSAGSEHTCAALQGGTVQCWGRGLEGQVGDGAGQTRGTPFTVSGITSATVVGVGEAHSCAVLSGGGIRCWGRNTSSQVVGTRVGNVLQPVDVDEVTNVRVVSGGQIHTCALRGDGTAICWGANGSGQLGNPDALSGESPVLVFGP